MTAPRKTSAIQNDEKKAAPMLEAKASEVLKKLRIQYAKERGLILRAPSELKTNPQDELYKLNVKTLSQAAIALRASKVKNPTDYEEFFYYLVGEGAPCEVILCFASEIDSDDFSLKKLCVEWQSNIHNALQYAVIEYLTDLSGVGKSLWKNSILRLLQFGADPNYDIENFADLKKSYIKNRWHLSCCTPLQMLIAFKTMDHDALELSLEFFKSRKEKVENEQFVFHLLAANFASTVRSNQKPLLEEPLFHCLDKNFPEFVRAFILKNSRIFLDSRVGTDYQSIGYLMERYDVYPFEVIINNLISRFFDGMTTNPFVLQEQFKYFEQRFPIQMFFYIQENARDIINHCFLNTSRRDKDSLTYLVNKYKISPFFSDRWIHFKDLLTEFNPVYKERLDLIMKFKQVHEITLQNEVFELPENTPAYEKFHRICLYAGLAENVATHNAKTKAFLKGLYSYKDKSPVSRYIINELAGPLYYRPTFLMGTHKREAEKKNDASSVYTFSQSELYDKKLLSVIFNFLGDRESFVHTESKEECEESPEERKEREEAEVSANKWKLTLHS